MINIAALLIILDLVTLNFYVESPSSTRKLFNYNNIRGGLEYSISTFGNILYNEKDEVSIYAPEN